MSTSLQELSFNLPTEKLTESLQQAVQLPPTFNRQRRRASMHDAIDHTKINTRLYERVVSMIIFFPWDCKQTDLYVAPPSVFFGRYFRVQSQVVCLWRCVTKLPIDNVFWHSPAFCGSRAWYLSLSWGTKVPDLIRWRVCPQNPLSWFLITVLQ
jgi:hypothetical protein